MCGFFSANTIYIAIISFFLRARAADNDYHETIMSHTEVCGNLSAISALFTCGLNLFFFVVINRSARENKHRISCGLTGALLRNTRK